MKKVCILGFMSALISLNAQAAPSSADAQSPVEKCYDAFHQVEFDFEQVLVKQLGTPTDDVFGQKTYEIKDPYLRGVAAGLMKSVQGVIKTVCESKN